MAKSNDFQFIVYHLKQLLNYFRWRDNQKYLSTEKSKLIGNCLISSGFLSYLGPFTYEYRMNILNNWITSIQQKSIPVTVPYQLEANFSSEVEILKYVSFLYA